MVIASSLDQVDADLPGFVEVAEHAHGVEAVEEIDDHEDEDGDPNALACLVFMGVEELHHGFEAEVHEDCDDRGEAEAGEKACVACQVQRQASVIPVIEAAELFDQEAESNFSKRNHEEYDGEVKEKVAFFRGADQEVHADDGEAVAEQKRQVHVAVVDEPASGEHPEIFDDESE